MWLPQPKQMVVKNEEEWKNIAGYKKHIELMKLFHLKVVGWERLKPFHFLNMGAWKEKDSEGGI